VQIRGQWEDLTVFLTMWEKKDRQENKRISFCNRKKILTHSFQAKSKDRREENDEYYLFIWHDQPSDRLRDLLFFVVRACLFFSIICSINHNQFNHVTHPRALFSLDSFDEIHIDKSNILYAFSCRYLSMLKKNDTD
jgi:hypothetical protein